MKSLKKLGGMELDAYGMIETYGLVAAIEGADSMLKSANVTLVGKYKVGAGLMTIIVKGDVGAVNASVSAGKISAEKLGKVISTHVIPRPANEISSIFENKIFEYNKTIEIVEDEVVENYEPVDIVEIKTEKLGLISDEELLNRLSSMKFSELRNMAKSIVEKVPVEKLTEKGSKLHSKNDVLEFLINFKDLI